MKKTIGIDLGTNSIGWAIREENQRLENQIINKGVLLFDKGVASDKGNEFPKVQKRTESRGKRRNYQAEKYRKHQLLQYLIEHDMCPLPMDELDQWIKYRKGEKRQYPQSIKFINWLRFDFDGDGKPDFYLLNKDKYDSYYAFRALAIDEQFKGVFDSNPHILGRVLYQLVQRRGFKGRDEEEAKTMLTGSKKTGTAGRDEIASYIDTHKSLGAALYYYQKDKGVTTRIRQRYNLRKDYENELAEICRVHGINESDQKKLWKSIIWQRPLRTQKGSVGLCTYEKNKRRVSLSHPLYQEFKTWVLINNLKIIAPAGLDQSTYLKNNIYPLFIRKSDFEITHIVKQIEKDGGRMDSKYASTKQQKTKVVSLSNFYDFEQLFGSDWKGVLKFETSIHDRPSQQTKQVKPEYTIEDVWHVLNTFDDKEKLIEFATYKLNLDQKSAVRFSEIRLNGGHATLSLSAVKRILPYLKQGIPYSSAVYLANMPKVLGSNSVSADLIQFFIDEVSLINEKVSVTKTLNQTINGLIKEHLNDDNRYFIDNNRELDSEEHQLIEDKLSNNFGVKTWTDLDEKMKEQYSSYVADHFKSFLQKRITDKKDIFLPTPRFHQELFNALQEKYDIPDENIKHLWHPSEQEKYSNAKLHHKFSLHGKILFIEEDQIEKFTSNNPNAENELIALKLLGNPEPISQGFKNPMALKTLYRLKQLINYLLQTDQIDEDTKVVIEIARELNDNNMRAAIRRYQNQRERENKKYAAQIEEINQECGTTFDPNDKKLLNKIRLWNEQNRQCLYTGTTIDLCDLLDGNKYDFEHTVPASMSFDSELKNLTIANTTFNRNVKKKRLPSQLENHEDILQRVSSMKEKIEKLERDLKDNLRYTKTLSDKLKKDLAVQNRHLIKFDLDYWKKKYESFTIEEYKPQWRNSQLRDTQTMTKYALPYLKTVFRNVTVQKGSVVNDFKYIYKVLLDEKKDRNKHAHHAQDAAILTLIPNAFHREKVLEQYNLAKEEYRTYHTSPIGWNNFKASYIIDIEDEVLANNLVDDRTLTQTYKRVRKRGRIVRDEKGRSKWSTGDTIRGQLHSESFYGAIKQPLKDEDGKVQFDKNGHMKLEDEIKMVIKRNLKYKVNPDDDGFKTLDELGKVMVDKVLFEKIKKQIGSTPFREALEKGIWMTDRQSNPVNKIRHVRCFFNALKHTSALPIHEHTYASNKSYKNTTYSKNKMNAYCLYYEGESKGKIDKSIEIISLLELSKLNLTNSQELYTLPLYQSKETKKGTLPLKKILKSGDKFLLYKNHKQELQELNVKQLSQRLYTAYEFEADGRIKLRHHLLAGDLTVAKKQYPEASALNFGSYTPLYRISKGNWNFAIEGIDFNIQIDGQIEFLF
ncbi:hypothetical protein N7E81_02490 [Reichenbachiella carrageenanivorans]|uniref:HNH Cas9-type domain-containing protein n=1 Tax=Reichenbachiella carrageenanivorans TaxID=2979869 RepID=A0ABY6D1H6_9BACT|nr:type II CRISPR RNA-guided endonuclease Cas9 [Reichenbachiella carrageenanivorans]UXX79973.1 hypothetical protein N7E81_02490 [Reichenbachiella carrageenanivorans]